MKDQSRKITKDLVEKIGLKIKLHLEEVLGNEWEIEARWEKWDVCYRLQADDIDFVHITEYAQYDELFEYPLGYALSQATSVYYRYTRYKKRIKNAKLLKL